MINTVWFVKLKLIKKLFGDNNEMHGMLETFSREKVTIGIILKHF